MPLMRQHFLPVLHGLEVLAHNERPAPIQDAVDFIMRNTFLVRLLQYLRGKFRRREDRGYACITCGLPYARDSGDKRVDD